MASRTARIWNRIGDHLHSSRTNCVYITVVGIRIHSPAHTVGRAG